MTASLIIKCRLQGGMRHAQRVTVLLLTALAGVAIGQNNAVPNTKKRTLQGFYAAHRKHVLAMLPPHSAFPPVLDLSKEKVSEYPKDRPWEYRSRELFASTPIADPGLSGPAGATTIMSTIVDGDPAYAIPAKNCDVIVALPLAGETRIAYNHKLVYSDFELKVLQVLKGKAKHGLYPNAHISAIQLGGSIRFPSGHQRTFILIHSGFVGVGKRYLLFIWKVNRQVQSYAIARAYLIQGGVVFPMIVDNKTGIYSGMPWTEFEAKVKHAITKKENTD